MRTRTTMSVRRYIFGTIWLTLFVPAIALGQGRVPRTDSGAVGGDVGVFLPADDGLNSGIALEGFYEYYLTARNSIRMGAGWAEPEFNGGRDSLQHVRIAFDTVYNWEGGPVHPFVGAGLGIYFLQSKIDGESFGDSETRLGATVFGGFEVFNGRTVSVKGELRYHLIRNLGSLNPDGAALTVGLKKYF
jgi:hypothetical protein